MGRQPAPCGIHVARTESLRFRLLKAVLIPITINTWRLIDVVSETGARDAGESPSVDSWAALAAASSTSRFDIFLSSVLLVLDRHRVQFNELHFRKRIRSTPPANDMISIKYKTQIRWSDKLTLLCTGSVAPPQWHAQGLSSLDSESRRFRLMYRTRLCARICNFNSPHTWISLSLSLSHAHFNKW